jgi:drug/metabolite transporter (DMT)-like permease
LKQIIALKESKILLVLVTLSILWGSSFLAIKIVIDIIPPLLAFGIRFIVSGAILLIVYVFQKDRNKNKFFSKNQWKDALILGMLIIMGGQGLLVWGEQYLSSGMTALLNSTIPLWVAIIALLAFKQRLKKNMILGLIAGFAGLMILINPFSGNNHLNLIGIISLTLSSIFWAAGSLYSNRIHNSDSIFASAGLLLCVGGLMLITASFIVGEFNNLQISHITLNSIVAFSYLIFLCTSVGYAEFFWLLRVESASVANSFAYIVPVIAVILGWLIFEEDITLSTIIATSIVIIGVALMVSNSSSSSKSNNKLIQK